MQDLRKQVRVALCGGEVALPVDMAVIEIIERVYDLNVNFAVVALQNPAQVKLTQLAEVYLSWLRPGHFEQLNVKRADVREYIYTADIDQIDVLSGAVMGAALHFRKAISGDDMDALAKGGSIQQESLETKKPSSDHEQAPNCSE